MATTARRVRRAAVAGLVALTLGSPLGAAAQVPQPFCGLRSDPPATYGHVVWIFLENHGYGEIVGSRDAPFMNHVLAGCGLATNYHNITHPSLPNYIGATSGLAPAALGKFKSDCNAVGGCRTRAPSLFAQAPSWGAFEESMPKPCTHFFSGLYAASHNPAAYYRRLPDCEQHDVGYANLDAALASDALPAFTFIMPNMCHSMHNCGVATGDSWLAHAIQKLVASPAYLRGDMVVFVTFDEGEDSGSDQCVRNTHDDGCHVATFVVSPYTPAGARSHALFNHYALLRTTEELLGIPTHLGRAGTARSMRAAFGL